MALPVKCGCATLPQDHQLAKNPSVWDNIRNQVRGLIVLQTFCVTDIRISKVVEVLKCADIKFSTVDLVCFTWLEKKEDEEKDDDSANSDGEQVNLEDSLPLVKAVEYNTLHHAPDHLDRRGGEHSHWCDRP